MASCATCGHFGEIITAITGQDEFIPWLARLEDPERCGRRRLLRCPDCSDMFYWEDDTAFFGSGCNDSQTLLRLNDDHALMVRALLDVDADLPDRPRIFRRAMETLGPSVFEVVLDRLISNLPSPALESLIPSLVEALIRTDEGLYLDALESCLRKEPSRSRQIARMLADDPRPKKNRAQLLAASCSKSPPQT